MSIAGCLPASAATRHIVLLYDERIELPGLSLLDNEIVRTLRSGSTEPIEVYREVMDLSRFDSNSYKTRLRDFLQAKYANKKIDVAVAILPPAFDFLMAYGDLIFPGTPIVFCGVDRAQLGNRALPPNVRGVLIKREFAPTLELALRLHPATEGVVVVSGTSAFDARTPRAGARRIPPLREPGLFHLPFRTPVGPASCEAFAIALPKHRPLHDTVSRWHRPTLCYTRGR